MKRSSISSVTNWKKLGLQGQAIPFLLGCPKTLGLLLTCVILPFISLSILYALVAAYYHQTISWLNTSMCSIRRPINAWTSTSRNYFWQPQRDMTRVFPTQTPPEGMTWIIQVKSRPACSSVLAYPHCAIWQKICLSLVAKLKNSGYVWLWYYVTFYSKRTNRTGM